MNQGVRTLFLIGFMGAGKSTIGRMVAPAVGMPFIDLDKRIEERAGVSVDRIFADRGEPAFRELEREALREVTGSRPAVVACGGGIVTDAGSRRLLREGDVVHLELGLEEALTRLAGEESGRPLIRQPRERLEALLASREPLYDSVADLRVDVAGRAPAEIADEVVEWMRSRG